MPAYRTVYGVKHRNEVVRAASRSGGFFTAVSDIVLEQGGVVYGCALTDDFLAEHRRAETKEERDAFRGSKYIQDDLGMTMRQAAQDLKNGKTVLFSGCPCQIHGLLNYMALMKIDTSHLLTIDILCHGVPSPRVWSDFLHSKYPFDSIDAVDFRDKKNFGWRDHKETVTVEGVEHSSKLYTDLFYSHLILRQSCFNCNYKKTERVSDITIGDFWRIENNDKEFDDDKGVSLVLVNTDKGQQYFDLCSASLIIREYPLATCIQPALHHNYHEPANRADFWQEYRSEDIEKLSEKYCKPSAKTPRELAVSAVKRLLKPFFYLVKKVVQS